MGMEDGGDPKGEGDGKGMEEGGMSDADVSL